PWTCSSAQSSPVKEFGAGKVAMRPWSRGSPVSSRRVRNERWRGSGSVPAREAIAENAAGPERRMMATPEGRLPEDRATMVVGWDKALAFRREEALLLRPFAYAQVVRTSNRSTGAICALRDGA